MKETNPISLAVIAQDEEHYIGRLLANVQGYVDEMVVIDGGSTDATVSICESYGAKVFHRKFDMDFSAQRNFALDMCSHNHVLVMDADEYCSQKTLNLLRSLTAIDKNVGSFRFCMITQVEYSDHIAEAEPTLPTRLLLKDKGRWVNKIHESFILHEGYRSAIVSDAYKMYNIKSSNRQAYNNALYYNLDNGILERPAYESGMFQQDNGEWVRVDNHRNIK